MSRAAVSKSRADKGAKPPPSHTPVVTHEIVPGKFTDQDWNFMLDKDGSDEFVEDIVEELVDNTLDKIYQIYLDRQLLPFTVTMAKDAILQIIDWQFLTRDEGETTIATDSGWMEDEEPDPASTDCWAQGSVPKQVILPRPVSPVAEVFDEKPDEEDVEPEATEEVKAEAEEEVPELEDKVSDTEDTVDKAEKKQGEEDKSSKDTKKKKFKFRPYRGKLKSAGVSKMTESLEQTEMQMFTAQIEASMEYQRIEKASGLLNMPASCHSILKVQSGRPPGNKDVLYDDMGNVVAVVKLNPEKLPSHRVKVNYQVVDPSVEAAQARLEAMRHGKFMRINLRKKKVKPQEQEEYIEKVEIKPSESKSALPPPLIESMELSPGVTVREGGRMRKGPPRYVRKTDMLSNSMKGLQAVSTTTTHPPLEVADLLDRHTPILRPLKESPPLPPIIPHPPAQPKIST